MYMGSGGAPEGVLAAAALKCMGGQIFGRLLFRNDDERARAAKAGITDLDRVYTRDEMVTADVIFAATGVTDGSILPGIKREPGWLTTETILMRSKTGSVRRMTYRTPRNDGVMGAPRAMTGGAPARISGVEASLTGRRWIGPSAEEDRLAEAMAQATRLPLPLCAHAGARGVAPRRPRPSWRPRCATCCPTR
jgi:hypothetical protein